MVWVWVYGSGMALAGLRVITTMKAAAGPAPWATAGVAMAKVRVLVRDVETVTPS